MLFFVSWKSKIATLKMSHYSIKQRINNYAYMNTGVSLELITPKLCPSSKEENFV